MKLRSYLNAIRLFFLIGLIHINSSILNAQDLPERFPLEIELLAYRCDYDAQNFHFRINASALNNLGQPIGNELHNITQDGEQIILESGYKLTVMAEDSNTPLQIADYAFSQTPYAPLQVLVVVDVTKTVPPKSMEMAVRRIATNLNPADELGILPFGREFNIDLLEFSREHSRIINEAVSHFDPQDGSNVLFDAVTAGINQLSPRSNQRQVMIVLTDSKAVNDQASVDRLFNEIRPLVEDRLLQIFSIGFTTSDDSPSPVQMTALGVVGNGYTWLVEEAISNGDILGARLNTIIDNDLQPVLNSELEITVDGRFLDEDESRNALFLSVLLLNRNNEIIAQSRITCPIEHQTIRIGFSNLEPLTSIVEATDLQLKVFPSQPPESEIIVRVDGSPLSTPVDENLIISFDPLTDVGSPGDYSLQALVYRNDGIEIARSDPVTIRVLANLVLTVKPINQETLDYRLEASLPNFLIDGTVVFTIEALDQTEIVGTSAFNEKGIATLEWNATEFLAHLETDGTVSARISASIDSLEDFVVLDESAVVSLTPIEIDNERIIVTLGSVLAFIILVSANYWVYNFLVSFYAKSLLDAEPTSLPDSLRRSLQARVLYLDGSPHELSPLVINNPTNFIARGNPKEGGDDIWLKIPPERVQRSPQTKQPLMSSTNDAAIIWRNGKFFFVKVKPTRQRYMVGNKKLGSRVQAVELKPDQRVMIDHIGHIELKTHESVDSEMTAY